RSDAGDACAAAGRGAVPRAGRRRGERERQCGRDVRACGDGGADPPGLACGRRAPGRRADDDASLSAGLAGGRRRDAVAVAFAARRDDGRIAGGGEWSMKLALKRLMSLLAALAPLAMAITASQAGDAATAARPDNAAAVHTDDGAGAARQQ